MAGIVLRLKLFLQFYFVSRLFWLYRWSLLIEEPPLLLHSLTST